MATLATESLFWVAAIVCAIAQVAILRGVVVDGAKDEPTQGATVPSPGAVGAPTRRARRMAEAAWALLPGVVLAIVLVWTWHTVHPTHRTPPPTDSRAVVTPATGA